MGMAVGGAGGGPTADINVTPLIDVLLVLLIIFMVITPLTPKGLEALVPQPPPPTSNDHFDGSGAWPAAPSNSSLHTSVRPGKEASGIDAGGSMPAVPRSWSGSGDRSPPSASG